MSLNAGNQGEKSMVALVSNKELENLFCQFAGGQKVGGGKATSRTKRRADARAGPSRHQDPGRRHKPQPSQDLVSVIFPTSETQT